MLAHSPHLVIPKCIPQSTWGGFYLAKLKGWDNNSKLANKRIGQTYELYGESQLAVDITDSTKASFSYEGDFRGETLSLKELVESNPEAIIGKSVWDKYGKMPLLIKLNQARGNSFQLHIKDEDHKQHKKLFLGKRPSLSVGVDEFRWIPKPESWYFLEEGYISCGINDLTKIKEYKKTCKNIYDFTQNVSKQIRSNKLTLQEGKARVATLIKTCDPHQFVNLHYVEAHTLVDLSAGGIHHSWEADPKSSLGNVVFEIQQDVMDEYCTIRSFDQGNLKDDGTVRELHIDDYFTFLDKTKQNNSLSHLLRTPHGESLLSTPYYSLDLLSIHKITTQKTTSSFHHLYVRDGQIKVSTQNGSIIVSRGHSCFVPFCVELYEIEPLEQSVVLKSYIKL